MSKYEVSQNFNNNSARNYFSADCDAATIVLLIGLMPKGMTVYKPTATGATGTARPVPTQFVNCKATCFDKTDAKLSSSFVTIKYGKATLSDNDIKTALLGKVEVPNGTACDHVSIKNYTMKGF